MHERSHLYIDGTWVSSAAAGFVDVIAPWSEERIGRVPDGVPEDVDAAVEAARLALHGPWARRSFDERAAVVERAAQWIAKHAEPIAHVIADERGTPYKSCVTGLVPQIAHMMHMAVVCARTIPLHEVRRDSQGPVLVRREPVGVVSALVPFNGPLPIAVLKAAPALLAGCSVVLKSSEVAPLAVYFLADAFEAAGLPPGVLNLVAGGEAVGRRMVEHPGVDMVSFTGSTVVGRSIAATCGASLKRCTLELGGKSAAIVMADADVGAAARVIGGGVFGGAGQYCRALTRVLAPASRYDEVVDALAGVAARMVPGSPYDEATTMTPLNSAAHRDRVERWIAIAREDGARPVTGGGRPASQPKGWFVEPTIFVDATNDMRFVREEIFGPVIAVLRYEGIDEAVAIANDNDYGLSGAIFGTDERAALEVAARVRTGTTGVNLHGARSCAPCGGTKASGIGQEHGPEGFLEYLDPKAVLISETLAAQLEADGVRALAPLV